MLSGSKNTVGWFPGGKAEPGNGPQDQSLARWGGDKQAGVRGKPYPAGPAEEAVCAHCGKEDGEEATSSGRPERGPPRNLYVHSWGAFRFRRKYLRRVSIPDSSSWKLLLSLIATGGAIFFF